MSQTHRVGADRLTLATEPRPKRARVLARRVRRQCGDGLADWRVLLDSAQGQQRRALGGSDAGQARDVQALVAALGPQDAQRSASAGLPQPHRPIKSAAGNQLPVGGQRHAPDRGGVAL